MTTLHTTATGSIAYSKGAADDVLPSCTSQFSVDREVPLTDECRERVLAVERRMASEGLRVLAVARKAEHVSRRCGTSR